MIATVHSHPGEKYKDDIEAVDSMGYGLGGGFVWGDYGNVTTDITANHKITRHIYVYFPATHKLYYVSPYNHTYIRRISTSKSLLYNHLR